MDELCQGGQERTAYVIAKVQVESAGCNVLSGSTVLFRYSVVLDVPRERPIPTLTHRSNGPVIQNVWYSGKRGKSRLHSMRFRISKTLNTRPRSISPLAS